MESGAMEIDTSAASDTREESECSIACLRRRAWAQSKDSIWQKSEQERRGSQGPQQSQRDGDAQRPSEEPGQVSNNITSWLIECRTPLGASLDDQSASPSRGPLRNGCSFEDDLSLGAEANHLLSSNNKTESCFGLAADQKRSQYKERGRSMNSTGSGKSSTVSSVSELLDLYEEDPEEILLNLGFGREEPDLASKVPSRFFNNSSTARGIDIKVYLGAQLQRMELENPNYALTSRFRQIEVLTTVANEFFQLYSQVSGQPVQRISSRDQGGEVGEGGGDESIPPLKRTNSALNVAKLLKKTISKHNLLAAAPESPETHTPNQHTQVNGHTSSDHTHTNGHAHAGSEQDGCSTDQTHQGETVSQKHVRKKDSCSLATVTEETNGDGETDRLTDNSPEQSGTGPAANGEHQTGSADLQSSNQRTEEGAQVVKEEKNLTSTPEKAPPTLAPPQLAQLRTENADSFDMEEIQSNDDEGLPSRTSRATDLLRTVSQQSDSSGFAEEPSADSNSYFKVQESSDSCDSETTVTSHPSQDVATPLALDQPAFILPDAREEEAGPGGTGEADGRSRSREEDEHDGSSEEVTQYTAHQLPRNRPMGEQQNETRDQEPAENGGQTDPEPEPQPDMEIPHSMSAVEQEPQDTQNQTETAADTKPPTMGVEAGDETQEEHASLDGSDSSCPSAPSSPVLSALNRAKQYQLSRGGLRVETPGRGRGRRGIPLQRSSSLPSSLLSPSRVVSSVRIQFGRGQTSSTQPRFSFKYNQEAGEDKEDGEDGEKEEEEGQTNCLSTLIINPSSSSHSNNQPLRLPTDSPIPPKAIPRYLMRSSCSLQSPSPPPDLSPGGHAPSWSTQSVPDLSSNQQPPGHFQQNLSANQNQQSWNQAPTSFSYANPNPNPTDQYLSPSPNPSPSLNPSPYHFTLNPHPHYPSPLHPYASLPNLHHNHSLNHHSSLTSLHQPTTPPVPQHGSLSNLHQPSSSTAHHHVSMGNLHPGSPIMHHQGYNHSYSHQSPYHAAPHGSQFASPYLGYHGYNTNPNLGFPHPVNQCPLSAPEHGLHPGLAPTVPGFLPGLTSALSQGHSLHPGLGPGQGPSSTEMQLRRVLHDIRGTVQSLSQNRADTPDMFSEHRAAQPSHQSLAEFQQKRRSLNVFRSQMMDLELSIIRQQALVYKHLSPADRMEVEQLQSLRSAVREELQELEQQLEDRLMELTHTQHRGLHRNSSVDSLSTTSALRAMEPVSDLLREQLFLQSELSYDGNAPSTNPSSRSSSPVRGRAGGEGEQRQGVYKASINITPIPPPRPNTQTEEEKEEEEGEEEEGERNRGREGGGEVPEVEGAAGGVRVENLQQLIREIRESLAQEVRREIYSELLAAVSPRQSPLPTRQHRL
ncbi:protein ITPRID2 isoform X1 [Seriola aureovittata]|uniref:protein ITPRID2 isoform X1 n=2 Tax=Seriola aureovittata TaxID=2871759 RepID=UPI0024BEF09E|nr:protein ITPRID2 isoform X1 [Seriola aureovittata]XP_056244969.1 protein ITPRID2 isoform X1 [Seriola aureovittata]XP_056244970.1 protein ITPRID2 isoform X1 [Seriola aureovittata]XP_056244971.1 protein ITPRID2 isoform X1 [Seriola aureovittata]